MPSSQSSWDKRRQILQTAIDDWLRYPTAAFETHEPDLMASYVTDLSIRLTYCMYAHRVVMVPVDGCGLFKWCDMVLIARAGYLERLQASAEA